MKDDLRQRPAMAASILCVVGARPNLVKMAPIMAALARLDPPPRLWLVHTGQHYGQAMDGQFFQDLALPQPDVNLGVGSGSHAEQTATVMLRFEPVLEQIAPDALLVVGDVNSTLACALVASKKNVPVIHVEAGLRSRDRSMPEEINRILTDQLSELLLTSEPSANTNLLQEGIAPQRIHEVGNVMIDSLQQHLQRAVPVRQLLDGLGRADLLGERIGYAVITAHRPSNVDDAASLRALLELVAGVAHELPVIFPMHPRTRDMVARFGLQHLLDHPALLVTDPLGYLEMLGVLKDARVILTDSGGLQEEALMLGVPCITLRDSTERPCTVDGGGNTLVSRDRGLALRVVADVLLGVRGPGSRPALWDGHAAQRIAQVTQAWLAERKGWVRC
jgi:UDP-N-acetylglucosamine 2-epimerase (non-hydrolysing)